MQLGHGRPDQPGTNSRSSAVQAGGGEFGGGGRADGQGMVGQRDRGAARCGAAAASAGMSMTTSAIPSTLRWARPPLRSSVRWKAVSSSGWSRLRSETPSYARPRFSSQGRSAARSPARYAISTSSRHTAELGEGYIHVHHRVPLHFTGEIENKLEDLILVCANCHVMIHRHSPWKTPDELRKILVNRSPTSTS